MTQTGTPQATDTGCAGATTAAPRGRKNWKPDRRSGFVREGLRYWYSRRPKDDWIWRQVLIFKGLYLVDHGGSLWAEEGDGYKWIPEVNSHESIFYDMDDIYD